MKTILSILLLCSVALGQTAIQRSEFTTNKVSTSTGLTNSAGSLKVNLAPGAGITFTTNGTQITMTAAGAGLGDVTGPGSATDSNFAAFDGVTGKIIKDSGSSASSFATAAHTHAQLHDRAHSVTSASDHSDWPAAVDLTELGYLDGVTGAIQTQIAGKQAADADLTQLGTISWVSGDVLYRAANSLTNLAKGADGQVLKLSGGFPSWGTDNAGVGGSGDDVWLNHVDVSNPNATSVINYTSDQSSGFFADDIDYVARSGSWDIGADEYVAPATSGGQIIMIRMQ